MTTSQERLDKGLCLMCGDPLIAPVNDYRCCTKCTFKIQKAKYEVEMKRARGHNFKKTGVMIHRGAIAMQTAPLGRPVDP